MVSEMARQAAADVLDEISALLEHVGIGQVADLIRDGEYDEHDVMPIFARFEVAIRADQVERDAKVADSIARAAANEVHSYDSYGGPSLPGRDREVTRQQVADEISAAIRQKGSDHAG